MTLYAGALQLSDTAETVTLITVLMSRKHRHLLQYLDRPELEQHLLLRAYATKAKAMTTSDYVELVLQENYSKTAATDRRVTSSPAAAKMGLNEEQEATLNSKRNYGWRVLCVRSPYLGKEEIIVTDPAQSGFWKLEPDGGLTQTYNVRSDDFS